MELGKYALEWAVDEDDSARILEYISLDSETFYKVSDWQIWGSEGKFNVLYEFVADKNLQQELITFTIDKFQLI